MKPFWRLLDESPKFFTSPCCVQKSVMKISCDDIETSQFLDNLGINVRGDFMEVTKSFQGLILTWTRYLVKLSINQLSIISPLMISANQRICAFANELFERDLLFCGVGA